MKRITLSYLAGYLFYGGGLLLSPARAQQRRQSSADYGDVMPRVVGMFMLALSGLHPLFVRNRDYTYYAYSVTTRTGIVAVPTALYFKPADPLFLMLDAIVLVGLLPSFYVLAMGKDPS